MREARIRQNSSQKSIYIIGTETVKNKNGPPFSPFLTCTFEVMTTPKRGGMTSGL